MGHSRLGRATRPDVRQGGRPTRPRVGYSPVHGRRDTPVIARQTEGRGGRAGGRSGPRFLLLGSVATLAQGDPLHSPPREHVVAAHPDSATHPPFRGLEATRPPMCTYAARVTGHARCPICGRPLRRVPRLERKLPHSRGFDCPEHHAVSTSPQAWEQARIRQLMADIEEFLHPSDEVICVEHTWSLVESGNGLAVLSCAKCASLTTVELGGLV